MCWITGNVVETIAHQLIELTLGFIFFLLGNNSPANSQALSLILKMVLRGWHKLSVPDPVGIEDLHSVPYYQQCNGNSGTN